MARSPHSSNQGQGASPPSVATMRLLSAVDRHQAWAHSGRVPLFACDRRAEAAHAQQTFTLYLRLRLILGFLPACSVACLFAGVFFLDASPPALPAALLLLGICSLIASFCAEPWISCWLIGRLRLRQMRLEHLCGEPPPHDAP